MPNVAGDISNKQMSMFNITFLKKRVDSINETDYGRNTKLQGIKKQRRLGCKKAVIWPRK